MISEQKFSVIVVIFALFLFIAAIFLAFQHFTEADAAIENRTRIENVFVDVDGDGLLDLIVVGEVVFNQAYLTPTPVP